MEGFLVETDQIISEIEKDLFLDKTIIFSPHVRNHWAEDSENGSDGEAGDPEKSASFGTLPVLNEYLSEDRMKVIRLVIKSNSLFKLHLLKIKTEV